MFLNNFSSHYSRIEPKADEREQKPLSDLKQPVVFTPRQVTRREKAFDLLEYTQQPNHCLPYLNNIVAYLSDKSENQLRPTGDYAVTQAEITEKMKIVLYDWLFCIAQQFGLRERTVFLSLDFLELFMNSKYIRKNEYQLIGIACLFVASKYEEIYPPKVDDFCKTSDNFYKREEIFAIESELLDYVCFDVTRVLVYDFYLLFTTLAGFEDKVVHFGLFLLSLSSFDYTFYQGPKSIIAFALCYLLHKIFKTPPFFEKIVNRTGEKLLLLSLDKGKFEGSMKWGGASDIFFKED